MKTGDQIERVTGEISAYSRGMDSWLSFCVGALASLLSDERIDPAALPGIRRSLAYLKGVQAGILRGGDGK